MLKGTCDICGAGCADSSEWGRAYTEFTRHAMTQYGTTSDVLICECCQPTDQHTRKQSRQDRMAEEYEAAEQYDRSL